MNCLLKYMAVAILLPFCCLSQERQVSITIDDLLATPADLGEYEDITDKLLQTLTENKIPAIGFVNESRLYTSEKMDSTKIGILEKWFQSGMEIGNHTFSHVYINNTELKDYKEDVIKGELVTKVFLDKYKKKVYYFRHPQLRTGPTDDYRSKLTKFLVGRGYSIAPVTIDNDEYIYALCYARAKTENDKELMKKIAFDYLQYMENIFGFYEKLSMDFLGYKIPQTLLIHANNLNADYLDELVEMMKNRGYSFVSISRALEDKAYGLPEGTHQRGPSWLQRWMVYAGKEPDSHPPVSKFIEELYQKHRG